MIKYMTITPIIRNEVCKLSITAFKCPCCGAELTFGSESQKMECEYCGTELDVDAVSALAEDNESSSEMNWQQYSETTVNIEGDVCTYTCNSCGAEITGDRSLGATTCPYCDSPFVVNECFDGMLRPDFIIPFKISKEKAVEQFKQFCGKRPLLPGDFMSSHRIESLQGMYVPYWLFDCGSQARIKYRAERSTSWDEGDETVTRTDHYVLIREGTMEFEHVPVDGTSKLEGDITEAVEPFATNNASGYNPAYLSGYLADKYDVSAEDSRPRANERIRNSIKAAFRNTTNEYTSVFEETENIRLEDGKIQYSLMPMWIMTARYNDKLYTFAMNGQTGRFVGELPMSWKRFWAMFAGVAVGSFAVLAFILSMLGI